MIIKSRGENEAEKEFTIRIFQMIVEFCENEPNKMSQMLIDTRELMLKDHRERKDHSEQQKEHLEIHLNEIEEAIKIIS